MMIYQEKITPPRAASPIDENKELVAKARADDETWIKNLIGSLTGILRGNSK
jgi:hypothetical protein